jgi:hypothetical protein
MTSRFVLTDSHSFYLLSALHCGLCGSVGSWCCWLLNPFAVAARDSFVNSNFENLTMERGGFILPPCALHCGLWRSIGPCSWTKGSNNNTDELDPLQLAQETRLWTEILRIWQWRGWGGFMLLPWLNQHSHWYSGTMVNTLKSISIASKYYKDPVAKTKSGFHLDSKTLI